MRLRSRVTELVSYRGNWLIVEAKPHYSDGLAVGGGVQNSSHGLKKIYDLIIVEITTFCSNQATRGCAASLGRGEKGAGAWPGGTARGCRHTDGQIKTKNKNKT